jgi:hypothetical protein
LKTPLPPETVIDLPVDQLGLALLTDLLGRSSNSDFRTR